MSIVSLADARAFCGAPEGDAVLGMIQKGVEKDIAQFIGWEVERASYTRFYPKGDVGGKDDYFVAQFGSIPRVGGTSDALCLDHKYVLLNSTLRVYEYSGAYYGQVSETNWANNELTRGTHYALEMDGDQNVSRSGILLRLGADWPRGRGGVKVEYMAGFTATELNGNMNGEADHTDASDIRLATLQALGRAFNQAKMHQYNQKTGRVGGLVTSESIGGYSYSMEGGSAVAMAGMGQILPVEVQHRLWKYSNRYSDMLR